MREPRVEPAQGRAVAATLAFITCLLWLMAFGALSLLDDTVDHSLAVQIRQVLSCVFGAGLCACLGLIFRRLSRQRLTLLLSAGLIASIACALIFSAVSHVVFFEIWPLRRQPWELSHLAAVAGVVFWFFGAWSACYFAVTFGAAARQARHELEQSRLLSLQAQHKMLRYQINPHFLFNSLNAILALVLDAEVERAEEVITSLSAFLRIALEQDPELMVPLAQELNNARSYLAVERARFGDRLVVVEDVAPASLAASIPSMVLQPLLENAVRYGLANSAAPVTVKIITKVLDRRVHVIVSDDAIHRDCVDQSGTGVGQANVRERLNLVFGNHAETSFGAIQPRGYECELCFPFP